MRGINDYLVAIGSILLGFILCVSFLQRWQTLILFFLSWIIVVGIFAYRKNTDEFIHYYIFGVASGFIGMILKLASWSPNHFLRVFADW